MKKRVLCVRWFKFNAVGIIGAVVQLALLRMLQNRLPLLCATAVAVEVTILHNFAWHERVTWRDRAGGRAGRLVRFHLSNGLISMVGNLVLMQLLAVWLRLPPVAANLISIVICSLLNFCLAERWVFRQTEAVALR